MAVLLVTREQIALALFALVDTTVRNSLTGLGLVSGLVTSGRKLRPLDAVTTTEMPALFQSQLGEDQDYPPAKMVAIPAKRTMHFLFTLYTADHLESTVLAITQLNAMVDAIETSMYGTGLTPVQTLGGIVTYARIEGKVDIAEDYMQTGKSVAVIQIEVLRP